MEKETKQNRYREMIADLLWIGGGTAVSFGVGMIYTAAGIIVGGILAIAFGWLVLNGGDAQ